MATSKSMVTSWRPFMASLPPVPWPLRLPFKNNLRHGDGGESGTHEQEGSSSEPPATSASPSTSTTCTFTPQCPDRNAMLHNCCNALKRIATDLGEIGIRCWNIHFHWHLAGCYYVVYGQIHVMMPCHEIHFRHAV